MLGNQAQASTCTQLLAPISCANTAAATTSYMDTNEYEGFLVGIMQVGVITGTLDGKFEMASDESHTGLADVPNGAFTTQVTTSNDVATYKISFPVNGLLRYVRFKGTIVTGPAIVGVSVLGTKKYV